MSVLLTPTIKRIEHCFDWVLLLSWWEHSVKLLIILWTRCLCISALEFISNSMEHDVDEIASRERFKVEFGDGDFILLGCPFERQAGLRVHMLPPYLAGSWSTGISSNNLSLHSFAFGPSNYFHFSASSSSKVGRFVLELQIFWLHGQLQQQSSRRHHHW